MSGDWDHLRTFLALAEEGSLTAAAKRLRVSHPTVARRIKALEEDLGARLFDRLPDGFRLTEPALELLHDVMEMDKAADSIRRRSAGLSSSHLGTVRISVDETMAAFLARHLAELRAGHQCIEFEISVAHVSANLSRREADLLVRDRVPDLASLVGRKLAVVEYAVYGSDGFARLIGAKPETLIDQPWVSYDDEHGTMPGQAWQTALLGDRRPAVRTNNGIVVADAIRQGAGIGVLPCFLGDSDPQLVRLTPPIADTRREQWLLVHSDLRGVPRVRIVMDALIDLFRRQRGALEGQGTAPQPEPALQIAG